MGSDRKRFQFPPGAYFVPSDFDLIEYYLKPRVLGQTLVYNVVEDKDVYGPDCNPWKIFDINDHDSWFVSPGKSTEKIAYVFTHLSLISGDKSKSGGNTVKKAGCGRWGGKGHKTDILDFEGNLIGERKYLVFEVNQIDSGAGDSQFNFYNMYEYSLSGVYGGLDHSRNLVLCKVTYDSSKKAFFVDKPLKKQKNNCKPLKNKKHNKKNPEVDLIIEGSSVVDLVEGSSGVDRLDLVEGSSGVDRLVEEESVRSLDQSVCDDHLVGGRQHLGELSNHLLSDDDQGCVFSLDEDWFQEIMNDMEDALVPDNNINLGKRKFEAENAFGNKKICLR